MTPDRPDVDGLAFFTDAVLDAPPAGPSVFGVLDEDVVASRFAVVSEDDLGGDFFSDHGIEVDTESRRAFRDSLAAMGEPVGPAAVAAPAPPAPATPPATGVTPDARHARRASALTAEQRDFILSGPRI